MKGLVNKKIRKSDLAIFIAKTINSYLACKSMEDTIQAFNKFKDTLLEDMDNSWYSMLRSKISQVQSFELKFPHYKNELEASEENKEYTESFFCDQDKFFLFLQLLGETAPIEHSQGAIAKMKKKLKKEFLAKGWVEPMDIYDDFDDDYFGPLEPRDT